MSNDKITEQLGKLKVALATWEKELTVYSKWAIENDGVLSLVENQVIISIKSEIQAVKEHIAKIEKAKGLNNNNGNPGKTFTADTKKAWSFNDFQQESEQVVVDKTKLSAGQIAYFETYEKVAQAYINRMAVIYDGKNKHAIKEGKNAMHKLPVPITGKMLADAALKTFVKYGNDISKVVPVELMLAQCQCETHFGTVIKRKGSEKSPFNVGVYDTKDAEFLNQVEGMEEGIEMYYDLMAEDYLSAHSADELDDNFVNERGQRYATAVSYEEMMKSIEKTVKSVSEKNGLKLPNAEDLESNDTSTITNQPEIYIIKASVGDGGSNQPADVKLVKELLNKKINAGLTLDNPNVATKTIDAIKKFQMSALGKASGIIEPGSDSWKALSGSSVNSSNNNDTSTNTNTNQPEIDIIKASVGDGGSNQPADVKLVKELLNKKINAGLTLDNQNVATKTIDAIKKFQMSALGKASGIIEPGSDSWKALSGSTPVTTGDNSTNSTDQNQATPHNKDLHLYGAETETEKKLEQFAESFNDIQVRTNPGQEPAVFVGVRPPYFMNSGERAQKASTNRNNNTAVKNLINSIFGNEMLYGKATPPQIKEFLEESIKKNLIADKTNKGMRKFLEDFGVSTDCSGLAVQAMNFLLDGDLERDKEQIGIQSTGMMEDDRKKGLNYKTISTPSGLKAGDLMLNYKQKGTDTYHVRVILDVDIEGEAILFTTIESAASSTSSEDGTGIGQKRWKFPKAGSLDGLLKYNDNKKVFQEAGTSDKAYVYVRHKKLDK